MQRAGALAIVAIVMLVAALDVVLPLRREADLTTADVEALRQDYAQLRQAVSTLLAVSDLVPVQTVDETIVVEMRYAGRDNFTGQPVYPANICVLQRETARKLAAANEEFRERGWRIKLWDAYRPVSQHNLLWQTAGNYRHFFAHPQVGSKHSRGAAVDVTLVDQRGIEVEMPSDFDDFSGAGHRFHPGMSQQARENMEYLTEVLERHGFLSLDSEWWHFVDSEWWRYPLLDVDLALFVPGEAPEP